MSRRHLFPTLPLFITLLSYSIGHISPATGSPSHITAESANRSSRIWGRRHESGRLLEGESSASSTIDAENDSPSRTLQPHSNTSFDSSSTGLQYKVVRMVPETESQLAFLDQLEVKNTNLKLNFWTSPTRIGSIVDVMVPAVNLVQFKRLLELNDLRAAVIIEDVEKLIIQREHRPLSASRRTGRLKGDTGYPQRLQDDPIQNNELGAASVEYDFHRYGSYVQMVAWMKTLAAQYPRIVQYVSIGTSHEGRSIDGLEIGTKGTRKRIFWIDGGIHALCSKYGKDTNITRLVNELTWVIVPLLNPDGYEYTRSSTNPNVRLWRKNRSLNQCVDDKSGRCCRGVDLNRNFDFHFKESGSSDDPCSEIFQGVEPFSEPEARAVRDAVLSSRYRGRIDGFITLHTYSQIWVHPYGHKKDSYPGDIQDLYTVGKRATVALAKLYGTKYILGSGADTLYPASGGSEDWAKETGVKTWAGVRVVAEAIIQRAKIRLVAAHRVSGFSSVHAATVRLLMRILLREKPGGL